MAGLEIVKVLLVAVVLVGPVASQSPIVYETENSWKNITLPSNDPTFTIITLTMGPNTFKTSVRFRLQGYFQREWKTFRLSEDDDRRNVITVFYSKKQNTESTVVTNMLTDKAWTFHRSFTYMSVWSEQPVTWEVLQDHNSFTGPPTASSTTATTTMNTATTTLNTATTAMPSTQSFNFLTPTFLAPAIFCVLFALVALVVGVFKSQESSASSGLLGAASFSNNTIFKSTENLVQRQVPHPHNDDGRGSLHMSENSLYGVI